jgi:hypothetical protein
MVSLLCIGGELSEEENGELGYRRELKKGLVRCGEGENCGYLR